MYTWGIDMTRWASTVESVRADPSAKILVEQMPKVDLSVLLLLS